MEMFSSVDEMLDYWKKLFLEVVGEHAPLVKVRMKRESVEWIDDDIHKLMRARNYYRTKYRKTKLLEDWRVFKDLRNEVRRKLCQAKERHYTSVCQSLSKHPRKVRRQLNSALGHKHCSKITSLKGDGSTMITNTVEIVNKLASHFSCLPNLASTNSAPQMLRLVDTSFQFAVIPEEEVLKALCSLDETKATGPDGISARLLRMSAPAISKSLTLLFNASLKLGQFPQEWKEANVTPVPKNGDNELVTNYRPVSILPVASKVFETLIHRQLYHYLDSNNLLSSAQFGFRPSGCFVKIS